MDHRGTPTVVEHHPLVALASECFLIADSSAPHVGGLSEWIILDICFCAFLISVTCVTEAGEPLPGRIDSCLPSVHLSTQRAYCAVVLPSICFSFVIQKPPTVPNASCSCTPPSQMGNVTVDCYATAERWGRVWAYRNCRFMKPQLTLKRFIIWSHTKIMSDWIVGFAWLPKGQDGTEPAEHSRDRQGDCGSTGLITQKTIRALIAISHALQWVLQWNIF